MRSILEIKTDVFYVIEMYGMLIKCILRYEDQNDIDNG